ncbi:MAG: serine/threonine-protein kinase [Blastocatellia bacterium]
MSGCVFSNCSSPSDGVNGRCEGCGSLIKNEMIRQRYIIEQVVNRSKFGVNYLVKDSNKDNTFKIVKELQPVSEDDPDFYSVRRSTVERLFEREARVLMGLHHPGIPRLYAAFEDKSFAYLVEEYIPGTTLLESLDKSNRSKITEMEARKILKELASILAYLHSRVPAVVHRDIKPQNLMFAEDDGRLLLMEFAAVSQHAQKSSNSTVVGTAGYAPMEQLYGQAVPQSDLYAAGATILRLITGVHPSKLYNPIEKQFIWHSQANATPAFACIIDGLLAQDLIERTSSAEQLLLELEILRPLPD